MPSTSRVPRVAEIVLDEAGRLRCDGGAGKRGVRQILTGQIVVVHPATVDPHVDTIVVKDFQDQLVECGEIRHVEGFAKVDRSVAAAHVGQVRRDEGLAETDRGTARQPAGIVKAELTPRPLGRGRLPRAFEIAPRGAIRQQDHAGTVQRDRLGAGRDFRDPPFHRREGAGPLRVAEGGGFEGQSVARETAGCGRGDRRRVRDGGVSGLAVEVAGALHDIALHDLDHALERARIAVICGRLVEAALARLETGGLVEVLRVGPGPHGPMVIPHRPVRIDDRQAAGRVVDDRGVLVDQLVHLVGVEQQIGHFAQAVLAGDVEGRVVQEPLLLPFIAGIEAAIARGPGQVQVPGELPPQIVRAPLGRRGHGIQVIEEVLVVLEVAVAHRLRGRDIAVIGLEIHVLAPPLGRGIAAVAGHERVQVRLVQSPGGPLVVQRAGAALHLVEVAVGQVVLVEKAAVHLLDGHVQTPEVPIVLRAAGGQGRMGGVARAVLVGLVDDPKLHIVGLGGRGPGQIVDPEGERLEHPLLAPLPETALLDARREIQLVPGGAVRISVIVAGLEVVPALEIDLGHILAHRVAPDSTSGTVADVVVDVAVIDESSPPLIIAAPVLGQPRAVLDVALLADQVVDGQAAHHFGGILDDGRDAGLHRPAPGGYAIVDEIGKIRLRVIVVRHRDRIAEAIRYGDPVADQAAVHLHAGRNLHGVDIVQGPRIAAQAIIMHGDGGPPVRVLGVKACDVGTGIHDLVLQARRSRRRPGR